LITLRNFLEEKTLEITSSDIIIVCGDFNINGRKVDRTNVKAYREMQENPDKRFKLALDEYDREYDSMIDILSR
jgi:uncharacterized protein YfbU (UPF0304 family)